MMFLQCILSTVLHWVETIHEKLDKIFYYSMCISLNNSIFAMHTYVKVLCNTSKRLKGPKHDQIECGFFYINPTSMGGDLGTRPQKNIWVVLSLVLPFSARDFCLSAVGYSAKKNKNL
jgi:hypothetical protein